MHVSHQTTSVFKAWREGQKLSQADLGSLLSVSAVAVCRYENRTRIPASAVLQRIIVLTKGAVTANDFFEIPTLNGAMREKRLLGVVEEAVSIVGGVSILARLLGINRPALYHWKQVPANRVARIEEVTAGKVPRHKLRPDLFPAAREKPFRTAVKRVPKAVADAR